MARFAGKVGYSLANAEVAPGVYRDEIIERAYRGDVIRNTRKLENGAPINSDISTSNSISIVADAYANQHFFAIRYIWWAGVRWIVTEVEVQRPRLILRLGGVYNGPEATPEGTPDDSE